MEQALVDQVWQRAGSICEYCRMPQEHDLLTFQIDLDKTSGKTISRGTVLCLLVAPRSGGRQSTSLP